MTKEIQSIIKHFEAVNNGSPWFGRSVFAILAEVDPSKVFIRPNNKGHSLAELLYHMNTWSEFTLSRILKKAPGKKKVPGLPAFAKLDWRVIDPSIHSWKKGLAEFKSIHEKIYKELKKKDDSFLEEKVDGRNYNFRYLFNGLIEHTIYHLGQIAFIKKLLS